jgi:hypothetical protein
MTQIVADPRSLLSRPARALIELLEDKTGYTWRTGCAAKDFNLRTAANKVAVLSISVNGRYIASPFDGC